MILEQPHLVPVPIHTSNKSKWVRFKALFATRFYCLGKDWYYLNSQQLLCVIPGAYKPDNQLKDHYYVTDGKSYPRPLRMFMSSTGIGLVEGLAHDFAYRYRCQLRADGELIREGMTRKQSDEELRLIGTRVNHMPGVSRISYGTLRVFGWPAWNFHRKRDHTAFNDPTLLLTGYTPTIERRNAPSLTPASQEKIINPTRTPEQFL